ncbi:LacI family transcriptional regulator [Microterricola gilva]|uniref:LacI family transcriptional regulator n=1 Tax=Microterricola gilva TaxID=393267 RepID=A0A4Q8AMR9_9MICO|nr:LacI family DNA-binding transcriptional regulator [Microterricola gilva]RZU65229.1 LacI family transcriptional regulator [Microterricola gilva]
MTDSAVKSQSELKRRGTVPPTSADVARRANVSQATVSYVLNNVTSQKISEKTRSAVFRAAEELGYRPNRAAQSLAARASRIALFVVPSAHLGELIVDISSHLTARAAERGVTLIVHFEGAANRSIIDAAQDLRPRVVFSMFGLDDESEAWLSKQKIPVSSLFPTGGLALGMDDPTGSVQVDHLVEKGHSRIAFADTSDPGLAVLSKSRFDLVAQACAEGGLPAPAYGRFRLDASGAAQIVEGWVADGVTAVAAYNDEVAVAVLAGIRRAGLRCPQDLAVIGVDEMAINGSMEPPLSSIAFDTDSLAVEYASALAAILDESTTPPRTIRARDFMRVVERESTA